MKVIAVIPAYNEEKTIAGVIQSTRVFVDEVIVVDDGSSDRTFGIANSFDARVVRHIVNRGLGASLGTGIEAALQLGADVIITLDADGQHDPQEIPFFVNAIQAGADMVIGSRLLHSEGMPRRRQLANHIGNLVTFFLFGVRVTDSQSGFRAFAREAAKRLEIRTNRMEVSSELIAESKRHRWCLQEVPIKAIYTDYSLSKGQGFWVGLKTLAKLIMRRFTQ